MTESSPSQNAQNASINSTTIPIEIITEEEMAIFEAALALAATTTRSVISHSNLVTKNVRSVSTITSLSKRRVTSSDLEDFGKSLRRKKHALAESFYLKYRKKTGLFVTDFTASEWCEMQTKLELKCGKKKMSTAMKAGYDRHVKLEEEIVKRVKVTAYSAEDVWALKLLNFIAGANQLLFEGLTREIPVVGFLRGVWVSGVIDEIRMPDGLNKNPLLVDTKTRSRNSLPSEPQMRNSRLQLMCYKLLWDNLVAGNLPIKEFYKFFHLNPDNKLSKEIKESCAKAGMPAETLDEVVGFFKNTCNTILPADNMMLLRYESQKDNSLIGEDLFPYDPDWLNSQIDRSLEFWLGKREADPTPEEERWKCRHCRYASECPLTPISETSSPSTPISETSSPNCIIES